jgi:SAM-dependent methyltransferase
MVSGTEGYASEAEALVKQYESISFADVHKDVRHLIPDSPSRILDIGAGTGRDAAAFAAMGHSVVAVEPTSALRTRAMTLHPSSSIDWLDDNLPSLPHLMTRAAIFDVVMLTAVWMHLDEGQRQLAMPKVASLVAPDGVMILSLRYGPVPTGRRMFTVSADETIRLAEAERLDLVLKYEQRDGVLRRPGVSWARLAFRKTVK